MLSGGPQCDSRLLDLHADEIHGNQRVRLRFVIDPFKAKSEEVQEFGAVTGDVGEA